jgi:hypothetical protein
MQASQVTYNFSTNIYFLLGALSTATAAGAAARMSFTDADIVEFITNVECALRHYPQFIVRVEVRMFDFMATRLQRQKYFVPRKHALCSLL